MVKQSNNQIHIWNKSNMVQARAEELSAAGSPKLSSIQPI